MYSTHISPAPRVVVKQDAAGARLNWLLAANRQAEEQRTLFRSPGEEEQMLLMQRPVSTKKAYALFGMLLGALPPAAIFMQMLGYGPRALHIFGWDAGSYLFLFAVMNVVCCLVGWCVGSGLAQAALRAEHGSWLKMMLTMPLIGMVWGGMTGLAGGFLFFGVGAFAGAACAIPVGAVAFLLFALFHRLLERGGMIETRHFLPLACGVTTVIAALILGI